MCWLPMISGMRMVATPFTILTAYAPLRSNLIEFDTLNVAVSVKLVIMYGTVMVYS